MSASDQHLDTLQDIRRLMQRSSRFLSLSGLSGVAAGVWALAGVAIAGGWIDAYNRSGVIYPEAGELLQKKLVVLGLIVFFLSLLSAWYFTWRKAEKNHLPLWDSVSRRLVFHLGIPLLAGGLFILAMLLQGEWRFAAPASLCFYGVALLSSSRYTVREVQYLGIAEVVLGIVCAFNPGLALIYWALGFGGFHIIYGVWMWMKYDRKPVE